MLLSAKFNIFTWKGLFFHLRRFTVNHCLTLSQIFRVKSIFLFKKAYKLLKICLSSSNSSSASLSYVPYAPATYHFFIVLGLQQFFFSQKLAFSHIVSSTWKAFFSLTCSFVYLSRLSSDTVFSWGEFSVSTLHTNHSLHIRRSVLL